ncbi:DMP19 family protein [Roseibium album]|uniref:DMP19 family protein n=1 Tax=Roseibium album TaxID=311410 RepID=UPI003CD0C9A4
MLCVVELEVNNGGFSQYYFNSAGSLANFAPEAFTKIGAHNTAKIIVSANAKFGAWVPEGRFDRQEVLEVLENDDVSWDTLDNKFYEYPDDIERLLTAYANQ